MPKRKRTPEYSAYYSMKSRCLNPNSERYPRYGGRGIKISERWLESFKNFYQDMGDRPNSYYSLDRIDNDGNYCKSNCKWSSKEEQANNQSKTVLCYYKGEVKSLKYFSRKYKIKYTTLYSRIFRNNYSLKRAIETPLRIQKKYETVS